VIQLVHVTTGHIISLFALMHVRTTILLCYALAWYPTSCTKHMAGGGEFSMGAAKKLSNDAHSLESRLELATVTNRYDVVDTLVSTVGSSAYLPALAQL